jgi:hypothetical protein
MRMKMKMKMPKVSVNDDYDYAGDDALVRNKFQYKTRWDIIGAA